MGKKNKKKDKNKIEFNKEKKMVETFNQVIFINKLLKEDKDLSLGDRFKLSIEYESLYSYALSLFLKNHWVFDDYFYLLIRKMIIANAYYALLQEHKITGLNLKLFKIISNNREIGEKETEKFKQRLCLSKKTNLNNYIKSTPNMYLTGIFENCYTDLDIAREFFKKYNQSDPKSVPLLDLVSFRLHFNINSIGGNLDVEKIKPLMHFKKNDIYFKDLYERYNQLKTFHPYQIHDEYNLNTFNECIKDLYDGISKSLVTHAYTLDNFNYLGIQLTYLLAKLGLFRETFNFHLYTSIIQCIKFIVDTLSPTCKINEKKEMKEANILFKEYLDILQIAEFSISEMNDEENEKKLKELYGKYKNDYKYSYEKFVDTVLSNPSIFINKRIKTLTTSANEFIDYIYNKKENKEMNGKIKKLYQKSVRFSHIYGFLPYEDKSNLKEDITNCFLFLLDIFHKTLSFDFKIFPNDLKIISQGNIDTLKVEILQSKNTIKEEIVNFFDLVYQNNKDMILL